MLEHRPLHQELRLGRGNRDILYMLEHRPLHQDVRRNTGRERASGHLSCTCWGIGPCIRMSGAKPREAVPQELLFTAMMMRRMLPKLRAVAGLLPARATRRLRGPTMGLRPARAL